MKNIPNAVLEQIKPLLAQKPVRIEDLIGLPWEPGAMGPNAYDCWGLFVVIQKDHFGRMLPDHPVDPNNLRAVIKAFNRHPERKQWTLVAEPKPGDGVLLRRDGAVVHVGVWVEHNGTEGLLHSTSQNGVIFQARGCTEFCVNGAGISPWASCLRTEW